MADVGSPPASCCMLHVASWMIAYREKAGPIKHIVFFAKGARGNGCMLALVTGGWDGAW